MGSKLQSSLSDPSERFRTFYDMQYKISNKLNKEKHKISFEVASYVFLEPNYVEMYDFEHSYNEDRFVAIGKVGEIIFVVFTERGENIRLISARLATDNERRLYMNKTLTINVGQKPTDEQLKEVELAKKYPIEYDEDCQEMSPAMLKAFKCAVVQRNRKKVL